jgi:hypothetical protein
VKRFLLALLTALASSLPALAQPWVAADPKFDALPGATATFGSRPGVFQGQYVYRMEVPQNWNGELVMWAHGFQGTGPNLQAPFPPIRKWFIENGYAWASSSFSANGWAVREGADETRDLALFFAEKVKKPTRTYLFGASMGGNIVSDSLGNYPTFYDGAMPICGALTGLELFDYYLSYAAAADFVTGGNFFPNTQSDMDFYIKTYFGFILPALGTPNNYTAKGKQFDSIIKYLSGGERPYRTAGLNIQIGGPLTYYSAWFGSSKPGIINHNTDKQVATNDYVQYRVDPGLGLEETAINAGVKRIKADPQARITSGRYWYGIPSGRILVPVMSLHTTGDPFVPVNMEISYRQKVNAAGRGDLLVQRLIRRPGHCQFSDPELIQGFSDLTKWVAGGQKPKGEDVLGDISNAGLEWTNPRLPDDTGSAGK